MARTLARLSASIPNFIGNAALASLSNSSTAAWADKYFRLGEIDVWPKADQTALIAPALINSSG